jgi:hypothetical protein
MVVEVDFSAEPRLLTPEEELGSFFDTLVNEVRNRNPILR